MLFCPNEYLNKAIPGKLGMRGSATGDLHFDNVHVPAENVLIGEGRVPRTFEPSLPVLICITCVELFYRNGSICINERS